MDIEQVSPKKPNFLLILILFCATILVIFVLAYLFVDLEGGHLTFRHHARYKKKTPRRQDAKIRPGDYLESPAK
jgi:hypothetical protein